jgi:hypothetical protein
MVVILDTGRWRLEDPGSRAQGQLRQKVSKALKQ